VPGGGSAFHFRCARIESKFVQESVGPVASFVTAVTDKRPLDQVQSSDSEAISLIILY
jgi:hypothetical protein